ncbi:4Fe-4S binding protein [uncultured Fretibacterium sp.]|uniref:4Fe-4S binding protein n=1 Tax=uncultured Fretibacterium sp. TaxID=1678694 RepID=UPI0026114229|nr:4Fe-4S binding protein [uncultured Fretibacterium sp.]
MSVAGLKAHVRRDFCTACGRCGRACPVGAMLTLPGRPAEVNEAACVGCMRCLRACPVGAIKAG